MDPKSPFSQNVHFGGSGRGWVSIFEARIINVGLRPIGKTARGLL
jgi:hypothetical protein